MDGKTQGSFAEGWNVFYQARSVFGALLLIAMLANLGIFFAARFGGMTDPQNLPVGPYPSIPPCSACQLPPKGMVPCIPACQPCNISSPSQTAASSPAATMPATDNTKKIRALIDGSKPNCCGNYFFKPIDSDKLQSAMRWYNVFENVMNMTAIVTLLSVFFLVFCAMIGLMMVLAGQLPGAGALAKAFFWAIAIIAFLFPWDTFLPQVVCLPIGLTSFLDIQLSLNEVLTRTDCSSSNICFIGTVFQQWVKFVVIPLLVILIDIAYLRRTFQANREIISKPI